MAFNSCCAWWIFQQVQKPKKDSGRQRQNQRKKKVIHHFFFCLCDRIFLAFRFVLFGLVKHMSKAFRCLLERPTKLKVCAISCFHYLEWSRAAHHHRDQIWMLNTLETIQTALLRVIFFFWSTYQTHLGMSFGGVCWVERLWNIMFHPSSWMISNSIPPWRSTLGVGDTLICIPHAFFVKHI